MFIIAPIQDKKEQKNICGKCGAKFDPDCLAYSAVEDSGKLLGVLQFRIFDGYGVIYDLANACGTDDLEVLIIMGKTALKFMDTCGAKNAVIKTKNRDLYKILGFKKDGEGIYKVNLKRYFAPCENKHH